MRLRQLHAWLITLLLFNGCSTLRGAKMVDANDQAPTAAAPASPTAGDVNKVIEAKGALHAYAETTPAKATSASLNNVQTAAQAFERKIIRNAELTIELDDPAAAQRQLTNIAETLGGFVVTSETKNTGAQFASAPRTLVTAVLRIPAAQFNTALERIRQLGGRLLQDKNSGQDVTEEYIDLEARIRTQKALETQMLELLKRAGRIADAIEVQNQVAAVRTEIERLEGRQRFLANQSALSTISVTLHTPAPVVIATTAHGFWHQVKQAFGDGLDLASNITLGIIQFVIMLVPILLLIVLPLWLLWRLARPHLKWPGKLAPAENPVEQPSQN